MVELYICLKLQLRGSANSSGDPASKWFRHYGANYGSNESNIITTDRIATDIPGWLDVHPYFQNWSGQSTWGRFEFDGVTGNVALRWNGTLLRVGHSAWNPSGTTNPGYMMNGGMNPNEWMYFPNMVDSTITSSPYDHNFTDIYIDWTSARVEITRGSVVEIQPIKSWASGEIVIIHNKGAMTAGEGTLRVYNASRAVHTETVQVS